ncbi:MAG: MFS transporter [Fibrobacterota bacterium]
MFRINYLCFRMKKRNALIFLFPMLFDIIAGLSLFAGRHSFAEMGLSTAKVGSIMVFFGTGYIFGSLIMGKIIRKETARYQMLAACSLSAIIFFIAASADNILLVQLLYFFLAIFVTMFFNAFQAYMLGVDSRQGKPLSHTAAHYTFAWSAGFALGPFISGFTKDVFSWEQVYYVAAVFSLLIGAFSFFFRPRAFASEKAVQSPENPGSNKDYSLCLQAWLGVIVGAAVWNGVTTIWAVHSETLGFKTGVKGLVEFTMTFSQASGALLLIFIRNRFFKPFYNVLFGISGIVGLASFALGNGKLWIFFIAAVLIGLYNANFFSFMVYHSLAVPEKAVKRVSVNETIVGLSMFLGPLSAEFARRAAGSLNGAYFVLAGTVGVALFVQYLWIKSLLKRKIYEDRTF